MIKRLFFITALLISGLSLASADTRKVPQGAGDQLMTADYGGVDVASTTLLQFSSANVLLFAGEGVFQGVIIDTFGASELDQFILIRDTNSVVNSAGNFETGDDRLKIVLSTNSTNINYNPSYSYSAGYSGIVNWVWKVPYPIHMKRGLVIKASVNTLRRIRPLYTKFE